MKIENLASFNKTIGAKQTMKALERDELSFVYIANDSDEVIVSPIITLCKTRCVPYDREHTMVKLGQAAGIRVKAAAVGLRK